VEWVSEQRAHSIGLAAAAVLVAPLVRVLSSAISSTMCAASHVKRGKDTHGTIGPESGTRFVQRRARRVSVGSFALDVGKYVSKQADLGI
jgi:hypothetical protein